MRLGEITTPMLDRVIRAIKTAISASSAKSCRSIISGVLGLAVRYGALTANPVREVERLQLVPKFDPVFCVSVRDRAERWRDHCGLRSLRIAQMSAQGG